MEAWSFGQPVVGQLGFVSSVAQRHHEIGNRMALGAARHSMTRMVVRESVTIAFAGIGLRIGGGLAVSHLISAFLYRVTPTDPATFCGASMLSGLVALTACYIPARRASRVDPMVALRYE